MTKSQCDTYYVDGVPVERAHPELPFFDQEDWGSGFLEWVKFHHFNRVIYLVAGPPDATGAQPVDSIWVGSPPPVTRVPLGGTVEPWAPTSDPELN